MPKKKKTPIAEEHLDAPAVTPPATEAAAPEPLPFPPPPDTAWRWPDSTETRPLVVKHDDHARSEIGLEMGRIKLKMVELEDEKKGIAQSLKASIDDLDGRLVKFAHVLKNGGEEKPVRCRWVFEVSARDADGQWVRHPEYKSLVREDTGDIVHTVRITEQDRQANLDLGGEPAEAELETLLEGLGYKLVEDAAATDDETPFSVQSITDPDDDSNVAGDNRLAALKAALAFIRARAADRITPTTDAYTAGTQARRDNYAENFCPYEQPGDERADWLRGWNDEEIVINEEAA